MVEKPGSNRSAKGSFIRFGFKEEKMTKRVFSKKVAESINEYLEPRTTGKFYDEKAGFFNFRKRVSEEDFEKDFIHCSVIAVRHGFVVFTFYPLELQDFTYSDSETPLVTELKQKLIFKTQCTRTGFEVEDTYGGTAVVRFRTTVPCRSRKPTPEDIGASIEHSLSMMCNAMPVINNISGPGKGSVVKHMFNDEAFLFRYEDKSYEFEGIVDSNAYEEEGWRHLCRSMGEGKARLDFKPRFNQLPDMLLKRRKR